MAETEKRTYYVEIGALVAIVLAVFFMLKLTKHDTTKYYHAFFDDIQGLQPSSAVQIDGVRVGKISEIDLSGKNRVRITIAVKEDVALTEGTVASLASGGLTGERLILLEPGKSDRILPDNSTLYTKIDSSMMPISTRIQPMIESAKTILNSADIGLRGLNFVLNAGVATTSAAALIAIDKQTSKLSNLTTKINRDAHLESSIENAYVKTSEMAANVQETDKSIKDMEKSTAKAAQSPIVENVRKLRDNFASLKASIKKVEVDTGFGKYVNNPRIYNDAARSLDTLQRSLKEVKQNPPVISIIGGGK